MIEKFLVVIRLGEVGLNKDDFVFFQDSFWGRWGEGWWGGVI